MGEAFSGELQLKMICATNCPAMDLWVSAYNSTTFFSNKSNVCVSARKSYTLVLRMLWGRENKPKTLAPCRPFQE